MNQEKVLFQIALDILTKQEVRELLTSEMLNAVDIVEIGTPLIIQYGLLIVEQIKDWTKGDKILFADTKIADAGRWETNEAILQVPTWVRFYLEPLLIRWKKFVMPLS